MTRPSDSPTDHLPRPELTGRARSGHGEDMRYLEVPGVGLVSRVGLGTWQFGSREWGYGDDYAQRSAHDIVRRALELGVTFFDTAEVYAFGRSERILSEALGDDRHDVVVATKLLPIAPFPPIVRQPCARERHPAPAAPDPALPGAPAQPARARQRHHARHDALLDEGRIGAVGVSNYSLDRWREADAALGRPVVSNQVQFSLASRGRSTTSCPSPSARTGSSSPTARSPRGFSAAGTTLDHRPRGVRAANPLFGTENLRRIEPLLATLREVADAHDAKPAQVALAWLLGLPQVVVIPGASSVEQLESNVAAADLDWQPTSSRPSPRLPGLLAGLGGSHLPRHRARAPETLSEGGGEPSPSRWRPGRPRLGHVPAEVDDLTSAERDG